jgi:hypothetical protein
MMEDHEKGMDEVLAEQKSGFAKIGKRFEQNDFPPEVIKLLDLVTAVSNDEEALSRLRDEIIKHYGE